MFRITLNRVRDHIVIREGTDELKLTVDADPRIIVSALQRANKALVQIKVALAEFFMRTTPFYFTAI